MYGHELTGRIGGMLDDDGCTWADAKDTAGLHTPGEEQRGMRQVVIGGTHGQPRWARRMAHPPARDDGQFPTDGFKTNPTLRLTHGTTHQKNVQNPGRAGTGRPRCTGPCPLRAV